MASATPNDGVSRSTVPDGIAAAVAGEHRLFVAQVASDGPARREDFVPDEDDDAEPPADPNLKDSDVFIVEGEQERYGDKSAWSVALHR